MVSPTGPSPNSSGAGSVWGKQQPTLERLVTHYVAAKRSLTSTNLVYRANELVSSAREALKENAVLSAKGAFVKRSLEDHLTSLKAVHQGMEQVRGDAQDEFNVSHPVSAASTILIALRPVSTLWMTHRRTSATTSTISATPSSIRLSDPPTTHRNISSTSWTKPASTA